MRALILVTAALLACGNDNNQSPDGGGGGGGSTLHSLSVAVSGGGKVTSTPPGIDCGAACSATFAAGTVVALTAQPDSGWKLGAWTGACSGNGACSVTLSADETVAATFTQVPPGQYVLAVTVQGQGSVVSTPSGIDCDAACSARFDAGTQIALTPAAAPGWQFASWTGDCTGSGACSLTLSADATVAATFTQVPPQQFMLVVVVVGSGHVATAPVAIDCPPVCGNSFDAGTQVSLVATPDPGWQLSAWSGACSGSGSCSIAMDADKAVAATFTQIPVDECAGLVPALPQALVATMPTNTCLAGVSDDFDGNFLLGWGDGPTANYRVYSVADGFASPIGSAFTSTAPILMTVFAQQVGFTAYRENHVTEGTSLSSYTHDGAFIQTQTISDGDMISIPDSLIAIDPDTGTAALRHRQSGASWLTEYRHFGADGTPETAWFVIDFTGQMTAGIGVALSTHVLALESRPAGIYGMWLTRNATALTDWWGPIGTQPIQQVQHLMDGSVALRRGTSADWSWDMAVNDGVSGVAPVPAWLAARATDSLAVVHGGAAYALWGPEGQCGPAGLEVVAASGKHCGCIPVPGLSRSASIGRDSSLIVPKGGAPCSYDLYPKLLQ